MFDIPQYLLRVRELYHRLGEEATWEKLIATIIVENRRLRALKEELAKAGLSCAGSLWPDLLPTDRSKPEPVKCDPGLISLA